MYHRPRRRAAALAASLAAVATPSVVRAQPAQDVPAPARTTTYDLAFFQPFAPTSALDIVRHVPGFNFEQGKTDVRGFSGAAGNVVINGARPSAKSETLETILGRIPATRVLRVELGPGDLFGADYAGKSQVLNVVLSAAGGVEGNVTARVQRLFTGRLVPDVEGSVLVRRGATSLNLSAATARTDTVEVGDDTVRSLPDHALLEYRQKTNRYSDRAPSLAANLAVEPDAAHALHLNARHAPGTFHLEQANHVTPAAGPVRDDRLVQDYHNTSTELGGDVSRPFGGGVAKLVFLGNRRERRTYDAYFERPGGTVTGGDEQQANSRYDELLGRLSWTRPALLGFAFEAGFEAAYNRLEDATNLFTLDGAGTRTRVDLPLDRATVSEFRTEAYVNVGRALGPTLRLDASLAFEASRLKVDARSEDGGAATPLARRSLRFLKPGLTLDWKAPGRWRVQAIARRTVAQLDFYDFVPNAELAVDRISAGNAALQPQRTWETRLSFEHPLLGQGLVRVQLGHDAVSALQDRVLTEDGFDAPGNLGNGTRDFARATIDAPLGPLGLAGVRLRLDGGVQRTRVTDPLTARPRPWSGDFAPWDWSVELRRDRGKWSLGANLDDRGPVTFYRTDEIDANFARHPYAEIFAELRPDARTTLRLELQNLSNQPGGRQREFYAPNRSTPDPRADEVRRRNTHVAIQVSIRRGFGSGAPASGS